MSESEWLLVELYRRTGLRCGRRGQLGPHVYLISQDLKNPAILELETVVKACAPPGLRKRLYADLKNRSKSVAGVIWAMNGVKPVIRDCVVQKKHQTKYVLGPVAAH